MLKTSLLRLSESPAAKRVITRAPVSRNLARRFVAGDTLDEAIAATRALNQEGLAVSLDYLGESVSTREEAEQATEMAVQSLEAIAAEGLEANISIKPTQFGLDIDTGFCRANVETVLRRARELGDGEGEIFVRLDMEASDFTERTVRLVEELWEAGFRNVGTVLQSYLRRTPDDLERLLRLGSRIRLVKGAYQEPPTVAFPDKGDVDRMFVEEMKRLLEAGTYPAIATQDEHIVATARRFVWEKGLPKESFEFQMLYGVRRDLQHRLREEGYNVRIYLPYGDSWYPYLMRRLAERPANVVFMAGNVLREARAEGTLPGRAIGVGAGALAGFLAALAFRRRR
jgi:proline dehydrogenase